VQDVVDEAVCQVEDGLVRYVSNYKKHSRTNGKNNK
jgi:hypothetical protein